MLGNKSNQLLCWHFLRCAGRGHGVFVLWRIGQEMNELFLNLPRPGYMYLIDIGHDRRNLLEELMGQRNFLLVGCIFTGITA